jgi:hypothetical protein
MVGSRRSLGPFASLCPQMVRRLVLDELLDALCSLSFSSSTYALARAAPHRSQCAGPRHGIRIAAGHFFPSLIALGLMSKKCLAGIAGKEAAAIEYRGVHADEAADAAIRYLVGKVHGLGGLIIIDMRTSQFAIGHAHWNGRERRVTNTDDVAASICYRHAGSIDGTRARYELAQLLFTRHALRRLAHATVFAHAHAIRFVRPGISMSDSQSVAAATPNLRRPVMTVPERQWDSLSPSEKQAWLLDKALDAKRDILTMFLPDPGDDSVEAQRTLAAADSTIESNHPLADKPPRPARRRWHRGDRRGEAACGDGRDRADEAGRQAAPRVMRS